MFISCKFYRNPGKVVSNGFIILFLPTLTFAKTLQKTKSRDEILMQAQMILIS